MKQPVCYRLTRMACYRGYLAQGVVNNLSPLFFAIFQRELGVSYAMLSTLILFNFATQLCVDALCVRFVDRAGYRAATVFAHICCALGLALLGLLPRLLPAPFTFAGLALATAVTATGGGVIEVAVSPIMDSLPSGAKGARMSLLHSFYCWGQVAVVLLTSLAVRLLGEGLWWVLPLAWAALPVYNIFSFARAPLAPTLSPEEKAPLRQLCRSRRFLLAMALMLCAGASELAMSQWSSLFAEQALGLPKLWGDLLGPCLFAVFMGIGRTLYGVSGEKLGQHRTKTGLRPLHTICRRLFRHSARLSLANPQIGGAQSMYSDEKSGRTTCAQSLCGAALNLYRWLLAAALLCALCYLGAALLAAPLLSLLCCALCGLSVSLMWPGVLSSTASAYPKGGAAMFGLLAFCGDLGCSAGPALAGLASESSGLRAGMLTAAVFPALMAACLLLFMVRRPGPHSPS